MGILKLENAKIDKDSERPFLLRHIKKSMTAA